MQENKGYETIKIITLEKAKKAQKSGNSIQVSIKNKHTKESFSGAISIGEISKNDYGFRFQGSIQLEGQDRAEQYKGETTDPIGDIPGYTTLTRI